MSVGVAIGDPFEFLIPAANLNGGVGRSIPLNNITWLSLAASELKLATTATAGSRGFVAQFKDANGNQITNSSNGVIAPSTTTTFPFGAGGAIEGVSSFAVTSNQTVGLSAPWPILIPPGCSLVLFDASNVDVNDQISGTLVFTQ